MGMFNDHVSPRRNDWTYNYTGSQLLAAAVRLHKDFSDKEMAARNKMATFMTDMNISQSDPKINEARKDIERYGMLKEQCQVFKHEFKRNAEKLYELGLGDVTFFGLAE
jgi:hypothetical protein